ncbi:MAG TPA: hypothetical protein VFQ44_05300 [Streptosporangiaceae bacterium]|nr:hypothetical protein [Streptosporangiaceae bacterium]
MGLRQTGAALTGGCPFHEGHEDNNGQNAAVDFLNGQLADITLTQ